MMTTRRNVLVLALAQASMVTGSSIVAATAPLVGSSLGGGDWATLPQAVLHIANTTVAGLAAIVLHRWGHRAGFSAATLLGMAGGILAALAITHASFGLFVAGIALVGCHNGFGHHYRMAATVGVEPAERGRAVAYVLAGGVIAAVIGPNLARLTRTVIATAPFAATYAVLVPVYLVALASLRGLRRPGAVSQEPFVPRVALDPPPAVDWIRQPTYLVALVCGAMAYAAMALLMTATPVAMGHHDHVFGDTAFVIQWHVLGMYLPSFGTGNLIRRFGASPVMAVGAVLGLLCIATNLHGTSVAHFWVALVLLGVGWNFLFIGATSLLTETLNHPRRARAQGLNDFVVFGGVALAALVAGTLEHRIGWQAMNLLSLPLFVVPLLALAWYARTPPPVHAGANSRRNDLDG